MQLFFDLDDTSKITDGINKIVQNKDREIVFLCIGTKKVIGDSFGPIVGQMLKEKADNVYGNLIETVNATNINEKIEEIYSNFSNPYVIVLDSALGNEEMINKIVIGNGGIKPGSALDKKIDKIGDMYINAIVGKNGSSNFHELRNVKKNDVLNMSKKVYKAIFDSICLKWLNIVNNHIK